MSAGLLPLQISVKRSIFRKDDPYAEGADSASKDPDLLAKIADRDKFHCRYCGFRSPKFQELHHFDDNHANNTVENLVTACPLCHMCNHVGYAGQSKRGVLIHIDPEANITQAALNQLVRTLWIGQVSDQPEIKAAADSMLMKLEKMKSNAESVIGSSDPITVGEYLLGLKAHEYESRGKYLKGVYLLPLKDGYKPQIEYWLNKVYRSIPHRTWIDLAAKKQLRWAQI